MTAPTPEPTGDLRERLRAAIDDAGRHQVTIAADLGITTKHLCAMLTGRAKLTLEWAERIAGACGREVVVAVVDRDGGARERCEYAEDRLRKGEQAYGQLAERAADAEAARDRWRKRAEEAERQRDEARTELSEANFTIGRQTAALAGMQKAEAERDEALAAAQRVREAIKAAKRPLTTTSRDMAIDRLDAWLYAIFVGWDCDDDHEHDDDCDAMTDLAIQHGWTAETVARLREHHAAIAALDLPEETR